MRIFFKGATIQQAPKPTAIIINIYINRYPYTMQRKLIWSGTYVKTLNKQHKTAKQSQC